MPLAVFFFAFIVALVSPGGAYAEFGGDYFECSGALASSEEAAALIKVQERYRNLESMEAQFSQESLLAALDERQVSAGKVYYARTGRMRWNYESPDRQQFVINGKTVWLYQESERQLIIDELSRVLLSDLPIGFLLGVGDLQSDFSLMQGCRTKRGLSLKLAPKGGEDDRDLREFNLAIDAKSWIPIGAQVFDVGGNRTTVIFDEVVSNKGGTNASLFMPDFPKGIDVTDRRSAAAADSSPEGDHHG